jgi:hypothetical protein
MTGQQVRVTSRRPFLSLLLSLLFLTSLFGSAIALSPARRVADELDKDAEAMIARATTGDQYLLGVGKADITGYEHQSLTRAWLTLPDLLLSSILWDMRLLVKLEPVFDNGENPQ